MRSLLTAPRGFTGVLWTLAAGAALAASVTPATAVPAATLGAIPSLTVLALAPITGTVAQP